MQNKLSYLSWLMMLMMKDDEVDDEVENVEEEVSEE